jgi:hypothetical protein
MRFSLKRGPWAIAAADLKAPADINANESQGDFDAVAAESGKKSSRRKDHEFTDELDCQ